MSKEIMDYYEEIHQEQYEPLSDEHIVALFIKYRETRDETIRNELITHNLRLVCNVVRKYRGTCDSDPNSIKDIFQAGNIGLMRAVEYYDVTKGYKFSSYAYRCIETEIIRLINNSDIIRITEDKKRKVFKLSKAIGELYQKLDREPTSEELAKFLEITIEELENLYKLMVLLNSKSLNERMGKTEEDIKYELGDIIPDYSSDPNNIIEMMMETRRPKIIDILLNNSNLTNKEKVVIDMYYGVKGFDSHTLEEIGATYGLTRERIRQIRNAALRKMKKYSYNNKLDGEDYISDDQISSVTSYKKIRCMSNIMY